jgi:hypothetical protein
MRSRSTNEDHSFDRWLRFAPWAAAVLVVLCILALVVRLALYATSGDRDISAAETAEANSSADVSRPVSTAAPSAGGLSAPASSNGHTITHDAYTASGTAGDYTIAASDAVKPARRGTRTTAAPATPNSKSRIEIHGARSGSLLSQSDGDSSDADRSRPPDKSDNANSNSAAPPDVLANRSRRAPAEIGKAYTSVFGLEAEGSRFVYVFDRSGSMGEPDSKPLRAAKAELIRSLERLDSIHQFFLIFYNQTPTVFNAAGASGRLVFGTDLNKQSARSFIEQLSAVGGTNHFEALLIAMRLHPDVIFLLTDGEQKDDLSADELAQLKRLNKVATRIYVIQFASSPYPSNSLVQLARENGGEHKYIDIRRHAENNPEAAR